MHILPFAATAAAAAISGTAVAFDTTFALSVEPRNRTGLNLVGAYAQLYHKYNIPLPAPISAALLQQQQQQQQGLVGRDEGSTTTYPSSATNGEYFITVDIGTPPKRFALNPDTGSSDLWVYGAAIPKKQLKGQAQYDANASRTSKLVPLAMWLVGYIDYSFAAGLVYKDMVAVVTDAAAAGGGGLVVADQGLQVAGIVAPSIVQDAGMDGIFGLGFDHLNFVFPDKEKTWFSNIKDRLSAPLFTVDFQHEKQGKFTFGYVDKGVGPLTYTPVDPSAGYWSWTSPGYAIGGRPFQSRPLRGTLDTGTSVLLLPDDVAKEYWAAVAGAAYSAVEQGYLYDCGMTPPDFTFGVGDATITIPGRYVRSAMADSVPGKCIGAIQAGERDLVVFGAPALKAAVVVFDAGQSRLGWANKTLV